MQQIVNLTPHDIVLLREDGGTVTIPASGRVARVLSRNEVVDELLGFPVVRTRFGAVVVDGPEGSGNLVRQLGEVYVVSTLVAQALAGQEGIVSPDTGPESAVRDEKGRIIGVRRFQVF